MNTIPSSVSLPTANGTGVAGCTVYDVDGVEIAARTTAGIVSLFDGTDYTIHYKKIEVDEGVTQGVIVWDNGDGIAVSRTFDLTSVSADDLSPIIVDDERTWRFDASDQLTASNTIVEVVGFDGLVSMDFERPLPEGVSLASVSLALVTPATGLTIDGAGIELSLDRLRANVPVVAAEAGDYTVILEGVSSDGQTIPRRGRMSIYSVSGT